MVSSVTVSIAELLGRKLTPEKKSKKNAEMFALLHEPARTKCALRGRSDDICRTLKKKTMSVGVCGLLIKLARLPGPMCAQGGDVCTRFSYSISCVYGS